MNLYECPLCNLEFEGETCHSSCPMSSGCAMIRCPGCSYEFVQDGRIAAFLRRLIGRGSRPSHHEGESHASSPR